VFASICTLLITTPLSFLFYSEIVISESTKREVVLKKEAENVVRKKFKRYQIKLKRMKVKVSFINIIFNKFEKIKKNNLKGENNFDEYSLALLISKDLDSCGRGILNAENSFVSLETTQYQPKTSLTINNQPTVNPFSHQLYIGESNEENYKSSHLHQHQGDEKIYIREQNMIFYYCPKNMKIYDKQRQELSNRNKMIFKTRSPNFPEMSNENGGLKISCFQITVQNKEVYELKKSPSTKLRNIIKLSIAFCILFVVWFYIAIFVMSIYKQYGNNLFKICIMPLISMIVIKLGVTQNIMIFIATVLLYFFGNKMNAISKVSIFTIIWSILVPLMAQNHHKAILIFRKLMKQN
jgi:hypothetical protein